MHSRLKLMKYDYATSQFEEIFEEEKNTMGMSQIKLTNEKY